MNSFLDHYCERVTSYVWDEPYNVISNAAFLLVAFLIYRQLKTKPLASGNSAIELRILLFLIIAIGIGSATWHLLAIHWALWADRIPILLFISVYLLVCMLRILKLTLPVTIVWFVLFHVFNLGLQWYFPSNTLNGSIFYLPTIIFLAAITVILYYKNSLTVQHYFGGACILFLVAVSFRTADLMLCDTFRIGTHFIWHILIAGTIYLLMSALVNLHGTTKESILKNRNEN